MKDLILIAFLGIALIATLRYPFVGLITWAWFTIMTPHQLAYGAFGIPLNALIAATTIGAVVIHREFQRFRFDAVTGLLIALLIWQTIAQLMSLDPEASAPFYDRFQKTMIFVLLCAQLATNTARFHALVWILAGGIALYAAKGGLFTLATLGQFRVQGLPNTILTDNNHFGIATASILPMLIYLRGQLAQPLMRTAMLGVIFLSIVAIFGTHSRGALLSFIAFCGYLWWRSSYKISLSIVGAIALVPLVFFLPSKWSERMSTITSATEDSSFMGRVRAWEINYRLAADNPFTGAGLRNAYDPDIAKLSAPELASEAKAAHSIYFEILGGSGFVGLAIFLALLATAYFKAGQLERGNRQIKKKNGAESSNQGKGAHLWQAEFGVYSRMSLVVFCVGAASTSLEMWDGYLMVIALIAAAPYTKGHETEDRARRRAVLKPRTPLVPRHRPVLNARSLKVDR